MLSLLHVAYQLTVELMANNMVNFCIDLALTYSWVIPDKAIH